MEVVHVIRPADPRSVVALCAIAAVLTVVGLFKGYFDLMEQAGSGLIAVLNLLVIPFLIVRMCMNAYRHNWGRLLLGLVLIPAIGAFTYSEAQMMPHAKRYFYPVIANDTPLERIKYAAPPSWQLDLKGAPERVMNYARAAGSFGLMLASMDAKLYRYMGLAAFQQHCTSHSPITHVNEKTIPAIARMFSRARLVYALPGTAKQVCGSEEAIAQNYGLSLKELLAVELADNRAALAKIEALGSKFSELCNNNSMDTSCSVIGNSLISTTSDGGSVRGCGIRERREDCVRFSLPNPRGNPDRSAWGSSPQAQKSYDDWKQSLALLRNDKAEGCYGFLCRALYEYRN